MPLMIIVMILTSCATFRVSPCAVISVTLVKFDSKSLAIFRKRSEDKLTSRIVRGFLFVIFSIDSPPRYKLSVTYVFHSNSNSLVGL